MNGPALHWLGSGIFLILAGAAQAAEPPEQSTEAARNALSEASGLALQGDATKAVARLRQVPAEEFGPEARTIRDCMVDRFTAAEADKPVPDTAPFTDRAIAAYRQYWHDSLSDPASKDEQEKRLTEKLRQLLGLEAGADWDRVSAALDARLEKEGLHALTGRTPPLLELMAWKSEISQKRRVRLPEGPRSVTVRILDDFPSLGWSAYATCERSFTGGWVGQDSIFAVKPGWKDLDDENFRISFLAHETQHFADKAKYGEIDSWVLEYRAKLTELVLAQSTRDRLLSAFAANQGHDPAVPHSYANWVLLSHLAGMLTDGDVAGLKRIEPERLRNAARSLLKRDSAMRSKQAMNREKS